MIYDLDDLREFGVTHIGSETCGLGLRTHYGLTQEAWEHWAHFVGLPHLIDQPYQFLTKRYHATLVVPRGWMEEFLIYLVLQRYPRVIVYPEDHDGKYHSRFSVQADDGSDAFVGATSRISQYGYGYLITPQDTAEKDHGYRNRHYWTGQIE